MRASSTIDPSRFVDSDDSSVAFASSLPRVAAIERNIDAQTTRMAARMNASSISSEEEAHLHAERQKLLDKQFDKTITRAESIRLDYVRWSLDRIDDAKHGPAIDALERQIARYEAFAVEVRDLKAQLQSHTSRRR
jgi:hypothetical protein